LYAALVRGGCLRAEPPYGGIRCVTLVNQLRQQPLELHPNGIALALHVVPVLVGAFIGAPLLAREFEAGTFRFAWTQGTIRTRWTITKFALLAGPVTVAAFLLSALATWSVRQFGSQAFTSSWQAGQFDTTIATTAGWTLLAFALGVFAGTVIKRTVPAMAATAACISALALGAYWKLDYLLLGIRPLAARSTGWGFLAGTINTPAGAAIEGPAGGWVVRGWLTGPSGRQVDGNALHNVINRLMHVEGGSQIQWLTQHHYANWIAYQPASRYWLFQFTACGTLVLLAVTLAVATLSLVRRRA
jgi:hypothetical protein